MAPRVDLIPNTERAEHVLRDRGIVEGSLSYQDVLNRTINGLIDYDTGLNGLYDEAFHARVVKSVEDGVFVFGTPLLTNAGVEDKVTAACTVLPIEVREGLVDVKKFTSLSSEALNNAIGTGYDLSEADDPAAALRELNTVLDVINDDLLRERKRPVASMATLRADHPQVLEFIRAKNNVDFSKWRFNISLFVTEGLFEKASRGEMWELTDNEGLVVGQLPAMHLLEQIAESAHYCGEPGILFKDRIDSDNPTPQWEYTSTAPCAEVAMAPGEGCQFSYINLAKLVRTDSTGQEPEFDSERFANAVYDMTRLLDAAIEQTVQNQGATDLSLVENKRRLGVGITGFADLLMTLGIPYDAQQSLTLAENISELLDFHSKRSSVDLAISRGSFPAFYDSRYTDGEWLRRKPYRSKGGLDPELWESLFSDIAQFGIRNASTTSMPPTGTSSEIVNSSKSLEPHFSLVDRSGVVIDLVKETLNIRRPDDVEIVLGAIGTSATCTLPDELLKEYPYLVTARQLSPLSHLEVQSAFQSFLDDSMAKTINLPQNATVSDVLSMLWQCYDSGLKGVSVFRDSCLSERA